MENVFVNFGCFEESYQLCKILRDSLLSTLTMLNPSTLKINIVIIVDSYTFSFYL